MSRSSLKNGSAETTSRHPTIALSPMDVPRSKKGKLRRYVVIGTIIFVTIGVLIYFIGLDPALPSVRRDMILIGTVERGTMMRSVRGPGNLVPDKVRYLSALTSGRVEKVYAEPGMAVEPNSVLLKLSNPDVDLEALHARQQLSAQMARLMQLRRTLRGALMTQMTKLAFSKADYLSIQRQARTDTVLSEQQLVSRNQALTSNERKSALEVQLDAEEKRLTLQRETIDAQLKAQAHQVKHLRSIVVFQQRRVESMTLRAGAPGVLQDFDLEPGQWIQAGTTLGRVVQPGHLKAELRIPQTQAYEVQINQRAKIDTRPDIIDGRVIRVDPNVQDGFVRVEVALEGEIPKGIRSELSVDGTIVIEELSDVLHVPRPAYGHSGAQASVYRLVDGEDAAKLVSVQFGRVSVLRIEVVLGLTEGDKIILSDTSKWDGYDRIELK